MARAVWVDKEGNRYHRHFQASVAINRASGTKILIEEIEDPDAYEDGFKWQTLCWITRESAIGKHWRKLGCTQRGLSGAVLASTSCTTTPMNACTNTTVNALTTAPISANLVPMSTMV